MRSKTPDRQTRSTHPRRRGTERWLLPDPRKVMINKQHGHWVLTYYISADLTIRLRILHRWYAVGPDEMICEARMTNTAPMFQEVGRLLWHPADDPRVQEWPVQCREQFQMLSNLWCTLMLVGNLGVALGDEPPERTQGPINGLGALGVPGLLRAVYRAWRV